MEIVCRSPQEVEDDSIIQHYDYLNGLLNQVTPGIGLLYKGKQRERIKLLLAQAERAILGEIRLSGLDIYEATFIAHTPR